MSKITFADLNDKMIQTSTGLLSKTDLYRWLDENIEVKNYIPISKKYSILQMFLIDFTYDFLSDFFSGNNSGGVEFLYMNYELYSTFTLLMAYIDVELKDKNVTPDNYDLIKQTGTFDYIVEHCKSDYNDFKSQCDRVVGINDMSIIAKLNEAFEKNPSVNEFTDVMEKFDNIMKKKSVRENLKFINNINMFNNPLLSEAVEEIQKESVQEIKGASSK
jgi:hypothetical protein